MEADMRNTRLWFAALLVVALAVPALAQAPAAKPHVVILATGGTIAGAAASQTSAGYSSGAVAVDTLIAAVPQMKDLAVVTGEQIASIGSQDMNDEVWVKLAARTNELLASKDVDGVVITHGTDTLEETSYFLHLVVKSVKPVVMTGSMRPSTAMSADGPLNIYNAVAIAADPQSWGRGVMVAVNDDIHSAHDLIKTHTTDVETFTSNEPGLIGVSLFGKQEYYRTPAKPHTARTDFTVAAGQKLPRVDIIYAHANMSPDLIDAAVANGAKGIVIAGVGDGNMTSPAVEAVKRAVAKGVVVVRSSRTGRGIIRRNIELNDDQLGTVASMDLNPGKARVLLQLALTKTGDAKQIQGYFDKY
jgi:L-asparaginase